jgi:hypothetical protein
MWSVDLKYFESTLRSSPGLRWKRERNEARAEAERLREALAFYADPATYQAMAPRDDALDGIVPIKADRGERARVVLDG